MPWTPASEVEILDQINSAWRRMTPVQRAFWEQITIYPEKWEQHPYGDKGGGFWVVAIMGRKIIWYNEIEDGWNSSEYSDYGRFIDYWCNQDELESVVEEFRTNTNGGKCGPPQPGAGPREQNQST